MLELAAVVGGFEDDRHPVVDGSYVEWMYNVNYDRLFYLNGPTLEVFGICLGA